jgi:N-acetylneuraminic acid mutarotase
MKTRLATLFARIITLLAALTSAPDALAQDGNWEAKAPMLTARSSLQGAALNGLLYAIGGNNGHDTPIVEAYNPATNAWSTVASLNQTNYGGDTGRYAGSAVAVNGKVYMMGGWTNSPPLPSNTLSIYDPNTNAWSAGPTIPGSGYTACSEAAVIGSKIYLLNACNGYSGYVQQLSIFDTVANSWSTGPNAPRNHNAGLGAALNGKFYVTGGTDGSSYQPQLDVYDPAANTWTTVAGGSMPVNRREVVHRGRVGRHHKLQGHPLDLRSRSEHLDEWPRRANSPKRGDRGHDQRKALRRRRQQLHGQPEHAGSVRPERVNSNTDTDPNFDTQPRKVA